MIKGFRCRETKRLFGDQLVPIFRAIERAARRKLLLLHRATRLDDLKAPPGNRLEALKALEEPTQHSHQRPVADMLSLAGGSRR